MAKPIDPHNLWPKPEPTPPQRNDPDRTPSTSVLEVNEHYTVMEVRKLGDCRREGALVITPNGVRLFTETELQFDEP